MGKSQSTSHPDTITLFVAVGLALVVSIGLCNAVVGVTELPAVVIVALVSAVVGEARARTRQTSLDTPMDAHHVSIALSPARSPWVDAGSARDPEKRNSVAPTGAPEPS